MKHTGHRNPPPIDRGWAWMIVVGTFLQVFCLIGLSKSLGLVLLELVKEFDVSVAEAVLPATVMFTTYALCSPLAVIVGEILTVRKVVIFGGMFGFVAVALSSLMFNMTYFTIFFGMGIGIGGACFYGNGLLLLGKYFRKHRSLANGLALSGASVGQFALPPLVEFLLETYGLKGTILISSAIFLHGVVSGALFRSIDVSTDNSQQGDSSIELAVSDEGNNENTTEYYQHSHEPLVNQESHSTSQQDLHQLSTPYHKEEKRNGVSNHSTTTSPHHHHHPNGKVQDFLLQDFEQEDNFKSTTATTATTTTTPLHQLATSTPPPKRLRRKKWSSDIDTGSVYLSWSHIDITNIAASKVEAIDDDDINDSPKPKGLLSKLKTALDFTVLKNHVTQFYTVVSLLGFFGYINTVLFLPAVFEGQGMDRYSSASLLSISGIGDLISRIGTGVFADRNFISRYKIMGISSILCGVNILMMSFADTFSWAAVHSFLYGFTGGTFICLLVVVMADFVGLADLPRNLVIVLSIQGIGAALGQPALGGLKTNVIMYVCAASTSSGGLLLFAYPLIRRWEDQRQGRLQEITA